MIKKIYNELTKLSNKAFKNGDVPISALVIKENKIISKGYNKKEKYKNPLLHAEIIAIEKATKKTKDWRLNDCDLYTLLFPCPLCASLIAQSRIKKVYYFYDTNNNKEKQISLKILESVELIKINSIESSTFLKDFFNNIRK